MNKLDYKILQVLADNKFHSGQDLKCLFDNSRAAISKRISRLNIYLQEQTDSNLEIISVIGKGYCLNYKFDYLSIEAIKLELLKLNIFINNRNTTDQNSINYDLDFEFLPTIDSTNNYLINKTIEDKKYHVCISEQQTKGRGRSNLSNQKTWYSPFGSNIYCSMAWVYPGNQNSLLGLSLVAGIALAETLKEHGANDICLKWPNDVLLNGKKISGILTEVYGEPNGSCKLVIGFGINVYNNFAKDKLNNINKNISQPWTNLSSVLSDEDSISRNYIIANLICKFVNFYNNFISNGISGFLSEWKKYDMFFDKDILINIAGVIKKGKYLGIDKQGALLVDINGVTEAFHSGEISMRVSE